MPFHCIIFWQGGCFTQTQVWLQTAKIKGWYCQVTLQHLTRSHTFCPTWNQTLDLTTRWQQPARRAPISEEQPATNHQGQEESAYKQRCFVFCILHETNQCFPLSEQQVSEASAARKCRSTFLPPPDKPDLTQEKQKGPKLQFS